VQKGDTFGRIAATYRVPLNELISLNPRVDPRRLRIGQTLQVPPSARGRVVASRKRVKPQYHAKVRSYAASKKGTRKIIHVVKRGDTLWDIAQAYGINHKNIRRWNGRRSSKLSIGTKLVLYVPQAKAEAKLEQRRDGKNLVYVVQRGDNLWDISRRFKTTPAAIRRWNNMSTSRITPGDRLTVRLADNNS
jgi:membrane-bound lytic murein transglycosylase D